MWLQKFVLFTLIILSIVYGSYGEQGKNGYTIPAGDINLEYGKGAINVTCVLTNEAFKEERRRNPNIRDFTFQLGTKIISEDQIIRINETAITYLNRSPKIMDSYLNCLYQNYSIALNSIVVGTKPNNVTDFDCEGYNLENLTCSWSVDQESKFVVSYILTYYYNNKMQRTTECGEYKTSIDNKKKSCVSTTTTQPYYRPSHDIIYFTLNSTNLLGEKIQTFEIEHYKKIKTSPPANLRVENSTVSSLYLSWEIPEIMVATHVFLEHKITYTYNTSNNSDFHIGMQFVKSCEKKRVYAELINLPFAFVYYDVRVFMRLNVTDSEKMWSEKASVVNRTNPTLPGAPAANRGGFHYHLNRGVVIIYWTQMNALYKNGDNFKYIIYNKTRNPNSKVTTTNGYYEFTNLNTSNEHIFEVRSENDVGQSLNYSQIVIPALNNPAMTMDFPVLKEYSDTKYELSWVAPTKGSEYLVNYTVYWCDNVKHLQFHYCSNIRWADVPKHVTSYNITVSGSNSIDMAISANGERESTSMKWSECAVRDDDNLTGNQITDLAGQSLSSTSITISWKLRCMHISKKIKFIVEYCEMNYTTYREPKTEIIFDDTPKLEKTYTINNLEPYTSYSVKVLMEHFNASTRDPQEILVTTMQGAPHTPTDLNIIDVTNNSITVQWSHPSKPNNNLINEIKVKYNNLFKNVTQPIQTRIPNLIQKQNFTLSDLLSYETYNISISACIIPLCSKYTDVVSAKTKIGRPSRIDKIYYYSLNTSITWEKPLQPSGNLDYYEIAVALDEKPLYTPRLNTTMYFLNTCGDNSPFGTVSYKVRAVNVGEDDEVHAGDWSKEQKQRCQKINDYTVVVCIILGLILVFAIITVFVLFGKRCYVYIITMKDVQFQLPDGLYDNKDRFPRGNELDLMKEPQGDNQFLLYDKDGIKRSGDSSGCSSGQDSAESDSGTSMGSSSDSGTEQPRTKDDDLVESVPLEDINLSPTVNGSNTYCQLGYSSSPSDSKQMTPFNFVKVDAPLIPSNESTSGSDISPYIRCDQVESRPINPGYVANPIPMSGYVPHTVEEKKSGYVPHPSVEKNTGYVMAAEKNSLITPSTENKGYVQVADVSNSQMLNNENLPRTNGYVSYGDVKSLPASPEMKATSAYVPHKQLDKVLNK